MDASYVADPATFAQSWIRGGAIVDGQALTTQDGIDRASIREFWTDLSHRVPLLRRRLAPVPLSLTNPVWVTEPSVHIDAHLHFHRHVEPDTPQRIATLIGRDIPGMDLGRPLWEVLVVPFDSGRVGFLTAVHHVMGDAQALFPLIESVAIGDRARGGNGTEPEAQETTTPPGTTTSGLGLVTALARQWLAQQGSARAALRTYRRSNTRERLGLWRNRVYWRIEQRRALRQPAEATQQRRGAYRVLAAAALRRTARDLGVSVSDLVVAATLIAGEAIPAGGYDDGGGQGDTGRTAGRTPVTSLRVAVAEAHTSESTANNRVWTPVVTVKSGMSLVRTAQEVRQQIQRALRSPSNRASFNDVPSPSENGRTGAGKSTAHRATQRVEQHPNPLEARQAKAVGTRPPAPLGYATLIELPATNMSIAGGLSTDFVVWPGGHTPDLVNCVATVLGDRLTITVTTAPRISAEHTLDTIYDLLETQAAEPLNVA